MMATRETLVPEEEEGGANEEEGLEAGAASIKVDSTWGCLAASYASLLQIDSLLMAPMT